MYSKKDDNENKGRKSGKGPKLSKGMKKAARQEKKTARKTAKKTKKEGVTRFVGSQPTVGKIAKGSAYATGFESREKKTGKTLKKKN